VFVPATASAGKLTQIELYGAQIVRVEGTREDCAAAALAASSWEEGVVYGSHAWSPLFLRGTATFAFEVVERLGSAPEAVVIPLGAGTLFLGAALGFDALKQAGLIERVPRLIGVQSIACAPLADAFSRGAGEPVPTVAGDTAAEGVKTGSPPRGREILEVARNTQGAITTATDEELWATLAALGMRGINPEPTSALAVAGALALQRRGELDRKSVVVAITGSGLKASPAIREALFSRSA
jgi:threonine synthase